MAGDTSALATHGERKAAREREANNINLSLQKFEKVPVTSTMTRQSYIRHEFSSGWGRGAVGGRGGGG